MNALKPTSKNNHICVLLGSNIDPTAKLPEAIILLRQSVTIQRISHIYESPPYGMDGDNFLNVAVEIVTSLSTENLKHQVLHDIEIRLGRKRTSNKYIPRTIDLDIIIVNGNVLDEEVYHQPHVCLPISDLLPDIIQPATGEPLKQLAEKFRKSTDIQLRDDLTLPHLG